MAKKSAKNQKSNELDAQEFFAAIALIAFLIGRKEW